MVYFIFFLIAFVLTYGVRYVAIRKSIVDIPNMRSSHDIPTPRGGGLAIVVTFYLGMIYFYDQIDSSLFYALLCAIPVAIVSIIDDIVSLDSKTRFLVQSFSAIASLYFLGGVEHIDLVLFEMSGIWLNLFAFISIVWFTNLYNFLDGIDGYAGSQAVVLGVAIFLFFGHKIGVVLALASLAFLCFNWHKASIFMGDVGSTTLGFIFAVFTFYQIGSGEMYIFLILLSLFWFDATLTLLRRYLNREKVFTPHKKHAYQRLVQEGWSHSRVVIYATGINVLFLCVLIWTEIIFYPMVFLLNMVLLAMVYLWIEKRKSFYDV